MEKTMQPKTDIAQKKVSVVVITYNHAPYVRQCLDGILNQEVNFDYEIVIHDDASTDGTADIIREYIGRYPDKFVPVLQTENQYSKGCHSIIASFCMPHLSGKYMAVVEGDDYWCDSHKLQRQVDFLESHPDYGLVYGRCISFNQDIQSFGDEFGGPLTEFNDLFFHSTIPTATIMVCADLARKYYAEVREYIKNWIMGDYPMWLWMALNSKIAFQPEVTAVYRVLPESASHSRSLARRYAFRLNSNPVSEYFIEHYGATHMTPDFIHRARTSRHRATLPMALRMADWTTVAAIREYFARAAGEGHTTPADIARMLRHPRLWRQLLRLHSAASTVKSRLRHL